MKSHQRGRGPSGLRSVEQGMAAREPAAPAAGLDDLLDMQDTMGNAGVASMAEGMRASGAGIPSGGGPLPHRDTLERAFGTDLGHVRAHEGSAAAEASEAQGAEAFATGNEVVFGAQPDLWLAAHETAHVVQQAGGLHRSGGEDRDSDPLERSADAIADRVASGGSAADLLPAATASPAAGQVQRYSEEDVGGTDAKIGTGGETALLGQQALYAEPALIASANAKLQQAGKEGSYIELTEGGDAVEVRGQSLTEVVPQFVSKPSTTEHDPVEAVNSPGGVDSEGDATGAGSIMALWTDCGKSSGAVTGSQLNGDRSVVYDDNGTETTGKGMDDASVSTWLKGEPNQLANEVYMDLIPSFIRKPENAKYLVEGVHFEWKPQTRAGAAVGAGAGALAGAGVGALLGGGLGAVIGGGVGALVGGIGGAIAGSGRQERIFRDPGTIVEAKTMYQALGDEGREKFDQEAGINHHANPEVGESYSMATEGDMPGFTKKGPKTWNYHWAGVIMKDGTDNITLENYAVTREYAASKGLRQGEFIDRDWSFGMYGTVDHDQTFHKRHLDSNTHGSEATSIRVRTDT